MFSVSFKEKDIWLVCLSGSRICTWFVEHTWLMLSQKDGYFESKETYFFSKQTCLSRNFWGKWLITFLKNSLSEIAAYVTFSNSCRKILNMLTPIYSFSTDINLKLYKEKKPINQNITNTCKEMSNAILIFIFPFVLFFL